MFSIFSCIVIEHNFTQLAIAIGICIVGSLLTMRLFARMRRSEGIQKMIWQFMAGSIGGATIWTTHFVAMLGYRTLEPSGYEPLPTLISLIAVIVTTTVGLAVASASRNGWIIEAGGAVTGLGIAFMHYFGMTAYLVPGRKEWDTAYVVTSLILAAFFGAVATNRMARPRTRFCKHASSLALVLAITLTHFIGMAALTVVPDSAVSVPAEFISNSVIMIFVSSVMMVILALGISAYTIDLHSTRAAVERYRHLSLHDPLTNLPNRAAFNEYLGALFKRSAGKSAKIAVLSFDLDRFKEINDVHGHSAGDAVLRAIAERFGNCLLPDEFAARVGGDEFIAIKSAYFGRDDVLSLAQRLLDEFCKPILWDNHVLTVGSSVGIAIFPGDAVNADDLLAQADVAMYRAKSTATNSICFYDSSMDLASRKRSVLAMEMRQGIQRGEFELHYQQQNDIVSRAVIGFEVLLRWRHRERGMILPGEFIPIAEKTGFIIELGEWVLRQSCADAASWKNPLPIAVNVASQQLADARLPAIVRQILLETGLSAKRLELEITESGVIADQKHTLHAIRQLKALGVKVVMDDYGTGYSSLSMLQSFPFDKIKIDRAFVEGIEVNRQSAAIVRSTLILAASLDIPVLAEGVETEKHFNFLRQEGCTQVQGFLFGKPSPRANIEAIVNAPSEHASTDLPAQPACGGGLKKCSHFSSSGIATC